MDRRDNAPFVCVSATPHPEINNNCVRDWLSYVICLDIEEDHSLFLLEAASSSSHSIHSRLLRGQPGVAVKAHSSV